jgi:ATP-dependent Clp protease ATP-binding subunit ClpA
MEQLFRDRLREVRGFAKLMALWGGTLADWMVSVPASYWAAGAPNRPFSSFGNPARNCIFFARCEANSFSGSVVTVNHLLLGILRQQPALVPETALETMVRTIEAEEPLGRCRPLILNPHANRLRVPALVGPGNLELGEEASRVVTAATGTAHTAGRQEVTPADLATAILCETNSLAARLLREHMPDRD